MRATPPAARMSAGMRSSAMTATAPASWATTACSGVTTSMMTPPLSICASPRFTVVVPACSMSLSYQAFPIRNIGGSTLARWTTAIGRAGAGAFARARDAEGSGAARSAAAAGAKSGCSGSASAWPERTASASPSGVGQGRRQRLGRDARIGEARVGGGRQRVRALPVGAVGRLGLGRSSGEGATR